MHRKIWNIQKHILQFKVFCLRTAVNRVTYNVINSTTHKSYHCIASSRELCTKIYNKYYPEWAKSTVKIIPGLKDCLVYVRSLVRQLLLPEQLETRCK